MRSRLRTEDEDTAALYFPSAYMAPTNNIRLEKLTGLQLVKLFLTFYETRKLITTFASAPHLSLTWARAIQSMLPQPTS
jgi:hypothetical protein